MSLADELLKLQQLRDSGALTDDEFQTAKRRLLDPPPPVRHTAARPPTGPPAEDNSIGRAANRYVTNSTVLSAIGLVIFLVVLLCVIVPAFNGTDDFGDLCRGPNISCTP